MKIEPEFVSRVIEMYNSGKSQKEIVETTNQSYNVVSYWLRKRGVYDPSRRVHITEAARSRRNEVQKRDALCRYSVELLRRGFFYIDGYTNNKSKCRIGCSFCGETFERVPRWFSYSCPLCAEKEKEEKKISSEVKKTLRKVALEIEKKEKKNRKIEDKERFLNESHICPECGSSFCYRSYCILEGVPEDNISKITYCSKICSKKAFRKRTDRGRHIIRARRKGCEIEKGITLHKLLSKNGLSCAICGELCDLNDRSYGNGSGPKYPSIDHIIPLSKGGGHTWNNVQVAHIECNWKKGDQLKEDQHNG